MAKMRSKYRVDFHGPNGKWESVEADTITMLDGIEDSLVCFNRGNRTTFCLPFSALIHSRICGVPAVKSVVVPQDQ